MLITNPSDFQVDFSVLYPNNKSIERNRVSELNERHDGGVGRVSKKNYRSQFNLIRSVSLALSNSFVQSGKAEHPLSIS